LNEVSVELRFIARDLKKLDQASAEVLVAAVMQDERPPRGVAGLVDWRLCGQLSRLIKSGFFTGELGELLILPSKPALPFDKALFIGCGLRADFDERAYLAAVAKIISVLKDLKAGQALIELPGRHLNVIPSARALDLLLDLVGQDSVEQSSRSIWTLIDAPEVQKVLNERRMRERRSTA
jgi:hypothetical protein